MANVQYRISHDAPLSRPSRRFLSRASRILAYFAADFRCEYLGVVIRARRAGVESLSFTSGSTSALFTSARRRAERGFRSAGRREQAIPLQPMTKSG